MPRNKKLGAQPQARDDVEVGVARREKDDRQRGGERAQLATQRKPAVDLGAQPQGEGVSFDGTALIATSESSPFRLWHIPCATEAEEQKCCGCGDGAALTLGVPALLLPWLRRRSGRREQRGRQQEAGRRRSG